MASIVFVDGDRELIEILRGIVYEGGYMVTICPDASTALDYLQAASRPAVVLLSHGGPSHDGERILAAIPNLPRHAYLLLSTEPEKAPQQWNPHTQAVVPVISMPFDLELLLEQVAAAEDRLKSLEDRE
jgi:DNA-binding NtrC family response regulator